MNHKPGIWRTWQELTVAAVGLIMIAIVIYGLIGLIWVSLASGQPLGGWNQPVYKQQKQWQNNFKEKGIIVIDGPYKPKPKSWWRR